MRVCLCASPRVAETGRSCFENISQQCGVSPSPLQAPLPQPRATNVFEMVRVEPPAPPSARLPLPAARIRLLRSTQGVRDTTTGGGHDCECDITIPLVKNKMFKHEV